VNRSALGQVGSSTVAVAHWHINAWGGAEYLVTNLAETVGADVVFTTGTPDPQEANPYGDVDFHDVLTDLSYTPLRRVQQRCDRVFEYAFWEDVDWREYGDPDIIITSGATPRAVITPDDTLHVNYCHSPPRWFYDQYHDRKDSTMGQVARPLLRHLRTRDTAVDTRVDAYFANSPVIARRLKKYYQRESTVLYPPIDIDTYRTGEDEGFYLHLGRLTEQKGVPAVVEAFAEDSRQLILAGGEGDIDDSVRRQIEDNENIDYRGFVSQDAKQELLATCRAVIFNGRDEDFGIVPAEANASGKACLTRNEGFPALLVRDGENGLHHDGTAAGIREALDRFEQRGISGNPREYADRFAVSAFEEALTTQLGEWRDDLDEFAAM
jgi:glycosyltransferase involved in cell wall biosynthesis